MGKPKGKAKKIQGGDDGGDGAKGKGDLHRVKKPSSSSSSTPSRKGKKGPSPGCSSGVRTRNQDADEVYRDLLQHPIHGQSADNTNEPSVSVKLEDWQEDNGEVVVKMEQGAGSGRIDEHEGILIDIPSAVEVKEEEMSDSEMPFEQEDEKEIAEETVKQVLQLVLPLVEQKDVFRCRLVSKQWRQIVDDFIKDSIVPKPYDDKAYLEKIERSPHLLCPVPKFRIVKYAYKFEKEADLDNFDEVKRGHMDSESSPFVGGATVTLSNLFINSSSALSPTTKKFLEKFGVHIRRLEIEQREEERYSDFDIVGFVNCVRKCVHFVPNLEKLKIKANSLTESDAKSNLADWRIKLFQKEMMDRTPKLNRLETLEFEYFKTEKVDKVCGAYFHSYENFPYLEQIFGDIMINPHYQTQLKQLGLKWTNELVNLQVDNVKELSLVKLKCNLSEINIQAPVQKLTLLEYWNWEHDVAKTFPHLGYLRLDKTSLDSCLSERNLKYWNKTNIHTLEILEVEVDDIIFPKLASAFPRLRNLIIHNETKCWTHVHTIREMKPEQILTQMTCFYYTNLWKFLTELEVCTFQFRDHVGHSISKGIVSCKCILEEGRKYECPFKNIVETRQGYQRYSEGMFVLYGEEN